MPEPVSQAEQARLLKLATYASVVVATILIFAKLAAYWYTSSVSVLASLIDSLMDIGASTINLFAVRYALSPPDDEHRFGHGKAESVAGLAQATFVAGSGLFLVLESVDRLMRPQPLEAFGIGLSVMVFAMVATLTLIAIQHHVISRTQSTAIKADSLHYKTDLLTNGVIIIALLLSQLGWVGVDPIFAIAIAGYILYSAWGIGKEAFHDLLDRELPEEKRELIIQIAKAHPKVRGMHDLRTRLSGRTEFVQMHLELDDHLPLVEAHAIADEVENKIKEALPSSDVVIHQDPVSSVDPHIQPVFKKAP